MRILHLIRGELMDEVLFKRKMSLRHYCDIETSFLGLLN